jgi:hypothetical protein
MLPYGYPFFSKLRVAEICCTLFETRLASKHFFCINRITATCRENAKIRHFLLFVRRKLKLAMTEQYRIRQFGIHPIKPNTKTGYYQNECFTLIFGKTFLQVSPEQYFIMAVSKTRG